MKTQLRRAWLAAILTVAGAAEIRASTVDTYNFTQAGFQHANYAGLGTLTGSFAGSVEDNGLIELADLQSFTATFSIDAETQTTTVPVFFSFDTNPGAGGGTLGFVAILAADVCVGVPAAFGLDACIPGPPGQPVTGSYFGFFTDVVPTVELVFSLTANPPQLTGVPEPADAVLLGLGLCALVWARRISKSIR